MPLRRGVQATNHPVLDHRSERGVLLTQDLRTRRPDRDGLDVDARRFGALNRTVFLQQNIEQPQRQPAQNK